MMRLGKGGNGARNSHRREKGAHVSRIRAPHLGIGRRTVFLEHGLPPGAEFADDVQGDAQGDVRGESRRQEDDPGEGEDPAMARGGKPKAVSAPEVGARALVSLPERDGKAFSAGERKILAECQSGKSLLVRVDSDSTAARLIAALVETHRSGSESGSQPSSGPLPILALLADAFGAKDVSDAITRRLGQQPWLRNPLGLFVWGEEGGEAHAVAGIPHLVMDAMKQGLLKPGKLGLVMVGDAPETIYLGLVPEIQALLDGQREADCQVLVFTSVLTREAADLAQDLVRGSVAMSGEGSLEIAFRAISGVAYLTASGEKSKLLRGLVRAQGWQNVLVAVRGNPSALKLNSYLQEHGARSELLLDGSEQRQELLRKFAQGSIPILVTTDETLNATEFEGVAHLVNYDFPNAESVAARLGRVVGEANPRRLILFCCEGDYHHMPALEKLLGQEIECLVPPGFLFA